MARVKSSVESKRGRGLCIGNTGLGETKVMRDGLNYIERDEDEALLQPQEATFDGIDFVRISSGTFTMGSTDDQVGCATSEKRRRVSIGHDFWVGKYEVTQTQWESVMGYNPSTFKSLGPVQSQPVETVTWHQVQEFIDKLNQDAGGAVLSAPD